MVERELPEGVEETPRPNISPEVHRARFEELAGAFNRGEFDRLNEDGTVTKIASYERHIDPLDRGDLALVREFRLRAAASGYHEAFSPLVLQTLQVPKPGETVAITGEGRPNRPLTFVQFGYEKPAAQPGRRTKM
jgi:hypothetical protein